MLRREWLLVRRLGLARVLRERLRRESAPEQARQLVLWVPRRHLLAQEPVQVLVQPLELVRALRVRTGRGADRQARQVPVKRMVRSAVEGAFRPEVARLLLAPQ